MAETAETSSSYREGDWYCEKCGDHQFERNLMCRKCSTPKPVVSSNGQASKAGDWICPNQSCKDVQFEKNMVCRKCGTARPPSTLQKGGGSAAMGALVAAAPPRGGGGHAFAPEDWLCASCGDHQFAKNVACRKCGAPKPAPAMWGGGGGKGCGPLPKAGDWICPNPQCRDLQFERNTACRKCGTGKPAVSRPVVTTLYNTNAPPPRALGGPAPASYGAAPPKNMAPEDWICINCGDHQFARNLACRKCAAPKPVTSTNHQIAKMGDWICPNPACKDVQFERNQECRKCGTAKPAGTPPSIPGGKAGAGAMVAYTPPMGGAAHGGYQQPMLVSGRPARPGDWTCPNCRDVQFGKNEQCRLCGTEKPQMSTNKQIFKAGDWICPNPDCGDVQFERNSVCRKCGTAKPEEAGGRARSRSPART